MISKVQDESNKRKRWTHPTTGKVVTHPYERSHFSNAGNCWCGRAEDSSIHYRGL